MSILEDSDAFSELKIKVEIKKQSGVDVSVNLESDVEERKEKSSPPVERKYTEERKMSKQKNNKMDETGNKLQDVPKEIFEIHEKANNWEINGQDIQKNAEAAPTWDNFLRRLTVDNSAKKRSYEEVHEKKIVLETAINKAKKVKEGREQNIAGVRKVIGEKFEDIKQWQEGIRRLTKEIDDDTMHIDAMEDYVTQENLKVEEDCNVIKDFSIKLSALEEDFAAIFEGKQSKNDFTEANEKLKPANAEFKQFLTDSIAVKESQLQCPYCLDMAYPPIYKCSNEHLICSRCFTKVSRCTVCNIKLSYIGQIYRSAEVAWEEWSKLTSKILDL